MRKGRPPVENFLGDAVLTATSSSEAAHVPWKRRAQSNIPKPPITRRAQAPAKSEQAKPSRGAIPRWSGWRRAFGNWGRSDFASAIGAGTLGQRSGF